VIDSTIPDQGRDLARGLEFDRPGLKQEKLVPCSTYNRLPHRRAPPLPSPRLGA
jgi:hypothetical protein